MCIALYCDIARCTCMRFNELLYEMNDDNSINEIILRISSSGGEVSYAFNIASLIENNKKPIHGIVDSECASAAMFILLACKTRINELVFIFNNFLHNNHYLILVYCK
jgi:hypothetical protein